MSLRSKLLVSIVMVAIATLFFAVLTVGLRTNGEVRNLVSGSVENRLVALREVQKERVESYFANTFKVVTYTAENPATVTAMENFTSGFSLTPKIDESFTQDLTAFYTGAFTDFYRSNDNAFTADQAAGYAAQLDDAAVFHQVRYIARNENAIGGKSELMFAAKEGKFTARYEVYHSEFHPILKQVRDQFEFVDVYLIDEQGRVVYSVEKNIDYATSLVDGPFADSALGTIWQQSKALAMGETQLSDYASYAPAFAQPVAFIATPIVALEKRLGTLVVQLSNARLTQVMTNSQQWSQLGLGVTGEAYLVGADNTLRSQSRFWLENASGLLDTLTSVGQQPQLQAMSERGNSVGLLQIDAPHVNNAREGATTVGMEVNYTGDSVLSAVGPVTIKDNHWAIVVEMSQSEVFAEVDRILRGALMYALIVLVIAIVLSYGLGILVSRMILNPIKTLMLSFKNIAEGDGDLSVHLDSASRNDEIGELSVSFNSFVNNIHDVVEKVVASALALKAVSERLAGFAQSSSDTVHHQQQLTTNIVQVMSQFAQSNADIVEHSTGAQNGMTRVSEATANGRETTLRCEQEMVSLGEQSEQSVGSIQSLSNEIESISQILSTIDGIAEQTSLLALNAAIEAARAGEQGRGFAVVADEVRSLSARTQQATIDIQQKIEGLQKAAESAVHQVQKSNENATVSIGLVKDTAGELENIRSVVTDIKSLSDAIDSLAGQQKEAVQGIETSVSSIQDLGETSLGNTEDVTRTTGELLSIADELAALVSRFKT